MCSNSITGLSELLWINTIRVIYKSNMVMLSIAKHHGPRSVFAFVLLGVYLLDTSDFLTSPTRGMPCQVIM